MASGFGLSDSQARKLADSLGIVEGKKLTDKQMAIIAKDAEAKKKLDAFEAAKIPAKTADINAQAHTAQATAQLNAVAAKEYTAHVNLEITKTINTVTNAISGILGGITGPKSAGGVNAAAMYAGLPAAFSATAGTLAGTDLGTYTATATAAPVNIIIQGAVDKDGTARQIRGILAGRERRTAGVSIGGTA
jgi:hypothetical protein